MAIRDKMRDSIAAYLRGEERIQVVFSAQGDAGLGRHVPACLVPFKPHRNRIIAVTTDRILVLDAGSISGRRARGLVSELPRATRLGPAAGAWHVIPAWREELRVHPRFFADIEAADQAIIAS